MRGVDTSQFALFSSISLERRVPVDHPLRKLRVIVDGLFSSMDAEFNAVYSPVGRPSIPPERLLRALLLQVLYSIRSERQLVEQLDYNLLFRWFVGLTGEDAVWERTVFSANRERLLSTGRARAFFEGVLAVAEWQNLISNEHFSVDGSMIEAWAGHKSFVRKDGGGGPEGGPGTGSAPSGKGRNPSVDFSGQTRSNATHQSTTDPEARLYKKGTYTEAKLRYLVHALAENRNGLIVDVETTRADGRAEGMAAQRMIARSIRRPGATVAGDKGYDTAEFVGFLKGRGLKAHIARKKEGSAVDARTARGKGYALSLNRRKRIEEAFGWIKTVGGLRKTRHRGVEKLNGQALLTFSAYNLVRILSLTAPEPRLA